VRKTVSPTPSPFGVIHSRFQQVYLVTEVGSRLISEIRFRGIELITVPSIPPVFRSV
jgi:hypothetical protein